jgi:four helix bundle protein
MDAESRELERRTKAFALRILAFVAGFRKTVVSDSIGYQLVRCGPSAGANYREANRAESRDDFIHKIGIIEKEASETCYWLELCEEAGIGDNAERQWRLKQSSELLAIFTSIDMTAKSRYWKPRS